jgi:ADP-ribosylglycohydrolase
MKLHSAADIRSVLRSYAAGDSFGVAYEFTDSYNDVDPDVLREKEGWPYGGVSDDTLLTLLTIQAVDFASPEKSQANFLAFLKSAAPQLRGLGPTTRSALGLPVKDIEVPQIGISNGALMRTALLGLAFNVGEDRERRIFVRTLAEATHRSASAVGSAIIGSALFADARAHGDSRSLYKVARAEADAIKGDFDIAISDWQEPLCTGISNESTETLNAVLWTVKNSESARAALQTSCELRGDTDTVAALSTALLVARKGAAADFESITWLNEINWSEISSLEECAELLHQSIDIAKVVS